MLRVLAIWAGAWNPPANIDPDETERKLREMFPTGKII